MIGRFVRWLMADESEEVAAAAPPPAPAFETPDLAGALVRCIADGWYNAPRGAPAKDQLCRVVSCKMTPLVTGNGMLLMLTLEGVPGEYAAMGFTKASPDAEPAMPTFTAELWCVSERVKARQGDA